MNAMKMAPFRCPNCDHEILVDRVRTDNAEPVPTLTVDIAWDETAARDPEVLEHRAHLRSMGCAQIRREAGRLTTENRALHRYIAARWWRRL